MSEHVRTCQNVKENESKIECLSIMFIIHQGIRGAALAAPLVPFARSKLFQNVHYSIGKKGSRPGEHPRRDREDKFCGEER